MISAVAAVERWMRLDSGEAERKPGRLKNGARGVSAQFDRLFGHSDGADQQQKSNASHAGPGVCASLLLLLHECRAQRRCKRNSPNRGSKTWPK